MANRNMNMGEASTNQDSCHISASCRILQDFSVVYINPEQTFSVDVESPRFQIDSNSETPGRYPKVPQTSPIDIQNDRDSSVFNTELLNCLSKLPLIILSSEERVKDGSPELSRLQTGSPIRSYLESSPSMDSEVKSNISNGSQNPYGNKEGNCSKKTATITAASHIEEDGKNDSSYEIEKMNLLRVDSENDFNTDFYRRSTLSDKESMIVNCGSDMSDISSEDEYESSDDNSSERTRDRIEFEALAIDSAVNPNIYKRFQHWKLRSKNRRALSLDEIIPSKILSTAEFSKTRFELNI